ncbi:pentapeptide repeat-containing protein [Deinococcus aerolatus]|uniref:pentapeptide repeat-containing protein n=1 Tax=Deinococcus aerolatus TaxID=522487 RepID=UPI00166791D1|nr:pentapeptide repeat-containing protein [Deinococcus aerolatus]
MTLPPKTRPPSPPKFPRGGLRTLVPAELEDESVFRGGVMEGGSLDAGTLQTVSFEGCVFREVNLSGVAWHLIRLKDVRLEGCDLSGARWTEAALERVQFTDCRLTGLQLPGAVLRHVRLTRALAPLSLWPTVDAKHLWLEDCDLTEAVFMDASLPGAVVRGCALGKTEFHGAALEGADLRGSDLQGVRLGLRELAGVTVEPVQLLELAHLLGVRVQELPEKA